MATHSQTPQPLAFSYIRFSSKEQGSGDSSTRQNENRDRWLAKQGLTLDTSLVLTDPGVSAFKGAHRSDDRNALAGFLELVNRGRVPRGSYLIVENLDRLSRENIRPALTLLLNLIDAGIRVVQLTPVETVFDENVEPMSLMMAIMELQRGHSESVMKSERVGKAWKRLKQKAATSKAPITKETPSWLTIEDGKFVVLPGTTKTIKLIYRLASEGQGMNGILHHLIKNKVPTFGGRATWTKTPISKLLLTRRVVGEYQPFSGASGKNRTRDGPPISGYYPAVITEDEWNRARLAIKGRKMTRGPIGKRVYLWGGLLKDARDGAPLYPCDKGTKGGGIKLINSKVLSNLGGEYVSFPLAVFEKRVLERLKELNPHEVLPGNGSAKALDGLTARRLALEERIEKIQAQMIGGDEDVAPLVSVVRRLQGELDSTNAEISATQQKAITPISDAWGQYPNLYDTLESGSAEERQEKRIRLRAILRRMIETIHCLFVGRGMIRVAAVRIQFREGDHRDYLIAHQPPHFPSKSSARSVVVSQSFKEDSNEELDLRNPDHAKRLEKELTNLPAEVLKAMLATTKEPARVEPPAKGKKRKRAE